MNFRILLSLIIMLLVKSEMSAVAMEGVGIFKPDSLKDDYNRKKTNIKVLIKDKDSETIFNYYHFFLLEKDVLRADSLLIDLLKKDSSVENKYRVSLMSYFYNSDSKTHFLFLSDPGRLNEYRAYFMKQGVSKLTTNIDIRTHYYNLVAIDSACYQIAPDSLIRLKMAQHYNSLAWYSMLTHHFKCVKHYLNQSLKYDPSAKYPTSNLALLLLLENHFDQAKALYLKYKDLPFDQTYLTYKEVFLDDFTELKKQGVANRNIRRIKKLILSATAKQQ